MRVTQCSVCGRIRQACVFVCVRAVAVCACVGSLRQICIRYNAAVPVSLSRCGVCRPR